MEAPKFSSYRLLISRTIGSSRPFIQISELEFFDKVDGEGQNILTGGVASASSFYGAGYEPANAFDGLPDTRWSSSSSVPPVWIRYDLQEPVAVRSLRLLTLVSSDGPADFTVQGSNDGGLNWTHIHEFKNFATAAQIEVGKVANLNRYGVGGTAHLDNGKPANSVAIYDWDTWELNAIVPVSSEGQWSYPVQSLEHALMVVVRGPAGTRPQAHGPITSEPFK